MVAALLGAVALLAILAVLRGRFGFDAKTLAGLMRTSAVIAAGLLAVLLFARGAILAGIGLTALAVWLHVSGRWWPRPRGTPPPRPTTNMTRAEACAVLGLTPEANEEDIAAAYNRLIRQNHPDHGGSDYLASKINQARDVLLGS